MATSIFPDPWPDEIAAIRAKVAPLFVGAPRSTARLYLDKAGTHVTWPSLTPEELDRLAESLEGAAATLRAYVDDLPAEIGMDWAGKATA